MSIGVSQAGFVKPVDKLSAFVDGPGGGFVNQLGNGLQRLWTETLLSQTAVLSEKAPLRLIGDGISDGYKALEVLFVPIPHVR